MPNSRNYPITLLPPPAANFSIEHESALTRSNMTSGLVRQRKTKSNPEILTSASWQLDAREIILFRAWFDDDLNCGERWFRIPLKLGAITKIYEMRFTGGYSESHSSTNNWDIGATLEIYDMLNASFGEVEAALLYYLENPNVPFYGGEFEARMEAIEINDSFTLTQEHSHKFIRLNSANNITVTLPLNSNFDTTWFAIFSKIGDGQVNFEIENLVILDSDLNQRRIRNNLTAATLHYVSNNRFQLYGDIAT